MAFFEKIGSNEGKQTQIKEQASEVLSGGIEGEVRRSKIEVVIGSAQRRAPDMVIKQIEVLDALPETTPKEIKKKYNWLRKHRFPVVPTFRVDAMSNEYLMTDATAGGRLILVDKHSPLKKNNIEIKNLAELHAELAQTAERAFNQGNGVLLGSDSYSLVVDPQTGLGRILLLDITRGTYMVHDNRARGRKEDIELSYAQRLVNHAIKYYFS